jgi:DNA-binding response OmpR family regulator
MFSNKEILVVDSDPRTLRVLKDVLIRNGFVVHFAHNCQRAMQLTARNKPDLILCDVRLEDMDALTFMKEVKETPSLSSIPFVFMAAQGQGCDKVSALEAGAEDFVTLPFDDTEFIARLKVVLRRTNKTRVATLTPNDAIKGDLKDINLIDLVQLLDMGKKTAVIQLEGMGKEGRVYVENGRVVHAISGRLFGKEGLFDLFTIAEGNFLVHLHVSSKIRTINETSTNLLIEVMHRLDQQGIRPAVSNAGSEEDSPKMLLYSEGIKELFEKGVIEEQGKS